jgi:hypothetical protein
MGRGRGIIVVATSGEARPRRGNRRTWTLERLRQELESFLGDRDEWPTVAEFRAAGNTALYDAVLRHGGAEHWARQLGVSHRPQRGGGRERSGPYKWTPERLEEELDDFLGDRDDWPIVAEFRAAGREALYDAVLQHGGARMWAARLGVSPPTGPGRQPYPLHQALEDARAVIEAEGHLPNQRRLSELGHGRLGTTVARAGGAEAFCRQHGLARRSSG